MGKGRNILLRGVTKFVSLVTTGKTGSSESSDDERYIMVKDVGADTTLFIFSGMAALYGGMPAFEFRKQLQKAGCAFNLVFIRDLQRWGYHVSPEGGSDGLAFYERVVRDQMKLLGARHHIAMGSSTGGAAAVYFGTRCKMAKAIAFGPIFNERLYCSSRNLRMAFSDIKLLLTGPIYYLATILMIVFGRWAVKHAAKLIASDARWDVIADLREAGSCRPAISLLYAARLHSDAEQAHLLSEFPEVKLVPVPTANHNCAGHLKRRGQLTSLLRDELGLTSDSSVFGKGKPLVTGVDVSGAKPELRSEVQSSDGPF